MCGCETWSVTLREEHGLPGTENVWTEERWSDGRLEETA
jgi:hypothetical protein